MSRRVHTADDVLRLARAGATELVVDRDDLVTPLARDVAVDRGIRLVERVASEPALRSAAGTPVIVHVPGAQTLALAPFPVDIHRPEMDVRLADVVTAEHGVRMAAGMMSLRAGSFGWTLDYDEVEYVIEGELHITSATQTIVGKPGDVIAIPKGSAITFGTPSWTRFLYVTYPADWAGAT